MILPQRCCPGLQQALQQQQQQQQHHHHRHHQALPPASCRQHHIKRLAGKQQNRHSTLQVSASMLGPLDAAGHSVSSWSNTALNSIRATASSLNPVRTLQQHPQNHPEQLGSSRHADATSQLLQPASHAPRKAAAAAAATAAGALQEPSAPEWTETPLQQALLRRLAAAAAAAEHLLQPESGHMSHSNEGSSTSSSGYSYHVITGVQYPASSGTSSSSNSCSISSTSSGAGSSLAAGSLIATANTSISSSSSSLKFAKHLAIVTNGCAPPAARFESLGWLLFECKRQQQAAIAATSTSSSSSSQLGASMHPAHPLNHSESLRLLLLQNPDGTVPGNLQLLEQIYLVGQGLADLGTADGLQPLSVSNGSRAIVSMDYSKLLERYLQQHGVLLTEGFISLLPDDELQAKAIYVATALETRCTVHALIFDKLIERAGAEGAVFASSGYSSFSSGAAGAGSSSSSSTGPLATIITNTLVNTSSASSSPSSSQNVVASPSSVNNNSNTVTHAVSDNGKGSSWLAGLRGDAVIVMIWVVAGKVVQVLFAAVVFAKNLAVQLLMLRAMASAANSLKAAAAASGSGSSSGGVCGLQYAPAGAGAVALPFLAPSMTRAAAAQGTTAAAGDITAASAAVGNSNRSRKDSKQPMACLEPKQHCDRQQQQQQQPQQQQGSASQRHSWRAVSVIPETAAGSFGLLAAHPLQQQSIDPWYEQQQQARKAGGVAAAAAPSGSRSRSRSNQLSGLKVGFGSLLYQLWAPEEAQLMMFLA